MKKLYEKNELWFALSWIIVYVLVMGNLRNIFGDESIYMLIGLILIAAALMFFIIKNKLMAKYGLIKPENCRKLLYFAPLLVLCTINLWHGVEMHYALPQQIIAVLSMTLVGLVEELIFRGLLFRAMEKSNVKSALIVSSITFGAGHIINLFTGQAVLGTVLQVFYAIAIGFAFMMMFYRSNSLLPSIIAHSIIDVTSKFSNNHLSPEAGERFTIIGPIIIIIVAGAYSLYLSLGREKKDC